MGEDAPKWPRFHEQRRTNGAIVHDRSLRADPRQRSGNGTTEGNLSSGEDAEDGESRSRREGDIFDLVEGDGSTYRGTRDPPGQSSVYIISGNHELEGYRLATFEKYPSQVPVSPTELAAAGFYYTGFKDRVKCFSCGMAVENWLVGDNAADRRWHKSDCELANGRDSRNIPSQTSTTLRLLKRLRTTSKHSACYGPRTQEPCSFQATSNTICHYEPGIPAVDVCSVARSLGDFQINRDEEGESVLQLAQVFSIEHEEWLLTLDLKHECDRRKTYGKWPSYPAPSLPATLAEEGFFYLGNLDRVQCFSCSGVLRNWAATDCVRDEHSKHFPNCRIVRGMELRNIPMSQEARNRADEADRARIGASRSAGESLKEPPDPSAEDQRHLEQYFPCHDAVNPHMRSEAARFNTFDSRWPNKIRATPSQIAKAGFFFLGENDKAKCWYCNGGLQNWEEHDEPWTEHAKWFPGCEWLLRRKGVDFVRRIFENNPNLNRPMIRNPVSYDIPPMPVSQLTHVVQGAAIPVGVGGNKRPISNGMFGENGDITWTKKSRESPDRDVAMMVKELQASSLCKKCRYTTADVICIPCGHLAYCSGCATANSRCPVCGVLASSVMKVYRA